MSAPPDYVIEAARLAAVRSPCDKSKRGVVLFCGEDTSDECVVVAGEGFNGPPPGFECGRSDACRQGCAKLCLHAEDRAIRQALVEWSAPPLNDLELLHVKVVDGVVVPGGGPSCWQCSRLVVEVGLSGVWLYEADVSRCLECKLFEDSSRRVEDRVKRCQECGSNLTPFVSWRFYTALDFHRETLRACGIEAWP